MISADSQTIPIRRKESREMCTLYTTSWARTIHCIEGREHHGHTDVGVCLPNFSAFFLTFFLLHQCGLWANPEGRHHNVQLGRAWGQRKAWLLWLWSLHISTQNYISWVRYSPKSKAALSTRLRSQKSILSQRMELNALQKVNFRIRWPGCRLWRKMWAA